jgi:3-deoxy-D-manno-octulosonate 8-phosphate phosphatase KdsC-like HAD superfamily phosphatase
VCFVGDVLDDAEVFGAVGLGCAVADAHPRAVAAARVVLQARGGERVMEELERRLEKTG